MEAHSPQRPAPSAANAPTGEAPLIYDLGADIGSPRWWRYLAVFLLGLTAATAVWLLDRGDRPAEPGLPSLTVAPLEPDTTIAGAAPAAPDPAPSAADAAGDDGSPAEASATEDAASPVHRRVAMRRGDTLTTTLTRAGIGRQDAYRAIEALSEHINVRRLQAGQGIDLTLEASGSQAALALASVALRTGFDSLVISRRDDAGGFTADVEQLATTTLAVYRRGTITDSLYLSARRVGVPAPVIVEMIRVFSFDVDFQREIRSGDGFAVYFTRRVTENTDAVEDSDILYTELILRGKPRRLYRFTPSDDGRTDYFDAQGRSVRKALMKTPVDGARLSSGFGRRRHPVLGYTRMHKGIDFAAPTGTPIMAAGDGVVEFAGRHGGYGNYVRIRHNSTYKTAYAHLSRYGKGIRRGRRVTQGQIIGYVGSTGMSTGPHLHYEVLRNGRQTNPLTLELPSGRVLEGAQLAAFKQDVGGTDAVLASLTRAKVLAAVDDCDTTMILAC